MEFCDGGDPNRGLIKMHFSDGEELPMLFTTYNMFTGDPLVFIMDPKVCGGAWESRYIEND